MNKFKNIANEYRPIPFWSWNEKLDCDETYRQGKLMKDIGIGGYFMHARGGLQTEYIGDEWFANIESGIKQAEDSGMDAWIYDENGWPSGFGGGIVTDMGEEYHQKYLRYEKGEKKTERTICNAGGYHFFYETNPFYVDNMDKKVVKAFIDSIYEPYYKRFGNRITGVFTDEPQLSRNGIPWSLVLPQEYKNRYNEEIYPKLIMLFEDTGSYKEFRIRFWKLVTDLFCEAFTKQVYDWCSIRNLKLTGHMLLEESLQVQLTSNGAVSPHYEYFDMPGVDWLGRPIDNGLAAKQLGSVANQLGKKRALTESFAMCGHNVSFDELRRITEWQLVRGVTNLCQHLEGYSIRGIRKRDYPPAMYYQQPWWSAYDKFINEMSRVGMIMAEGKEVCDTLLIHPMTAAWAVYRVDDESKVVGLNADFFSVMKILEEKNIMYHLGDETIMERHARVEGARLIIGKQSYDKVIVMDDELLLDTTKKLLAEYRKNGGVVTTENEIAQNPITDNKEVTYTSRVFDGFTVHYFVNSTSEALEMTVTRGSKKIDLATGELCDFDNRITLQPYSSIMVYDDGSVKSIDEKEQRILDLSGEWKIRKATENAITLDTCDVYFDGELKEKNCYILSAQNMACELERKVNVRLVFRQEIGYIPENLRLVCETPENFDISINGQRVAKTVKGSFIDASFKCVDIAKYVKPGINIIELTCDFVQSDEVYKNIRNSTLFEGVRNKLSYDMELESIYLIGDFGVFVNGNAEKLSKNAIRVGGNFLIEEKREAITLTNIEQQGFLFFAGELTVAKDFRLDDTNFALCMDKTGINAINIKINGKDVGVNLWNCEKIDISEYVCIGKNTVELTLVNNLRNLLGPHHLEEGESFSVGPHSFYKEESLWNMKQVEPWNDGYCFVNMSVK